MKNFKQLIKELPSKTVVFAFGRFNPPTTGHELLVKAVKKLAQQKKADHVIYASRSQDAKKNPLSVERKLHYLNMMFSGTHFIGANAEVRTFMEAAKELNKKYKNLIMIAGSDRVQEYTRILNTYNGKDFNFDTIEVVSAGERDPDADNATGMSATKMRALAVKGDYAQFKHGLPSSMRDIDGKRLMNDIRQGMGLDAVREQLNLVTSNIREQYFKGEIFKVGDIVEHLDETYMVVKRGSNHILVQDKQGNMSSKWITDVKESKRDFMLEEELTNKTLRATDKIKVARVLATMMGVEKTESTQNAEMLINLGLRRIRSKALNPEALAIIDKMLNLATQMGIEYDTTLKPSKLKEETKEVMSFQNFEKIKKKGNEQGTKDPVNDSDKDAEEDPDHDENDTEVGGLLVQPYPIADDNLRRRKVKYHLGEQSYDKEVTATHIVSAPETEHNKKQKRLAKSFIDRMQAATNEATDPAEAAKEKAQKETAKAQLSVKQAKEKESFVAKQADERAALRDKMKTEEVEDSGEEHDWESMIDILDFSEPKEADAEVEDIVNSVSDDELIDSIYDDDEFEEVDDETGECIEQDEEDKEIEEQLQEVLSRTERIKARQRLKRTSAKRQRATKIALKKYSNSATINKRARRAAVKAMKARLLRGRNLSKISVGEKERLERIIQKKKTLINRIALKMIPRIRKIEKNRLSHSKSTKGSSSSVF